MKLKDALGLRGVSETEENKKDLKSCLELRKAKYLKRTGSPGKYKYIYKDASPRDRKENEMVTYQGKQYRVLSRNKGYKGTAKMYDIATVENGKTVIKTVPGSKLRPSRSKQAKGEKATKPTKESIKEKVGERIANEIGMMSDEGLQRNIDRHIKFKEEALDRMKRANKGAKLDIEGKVTRYDGIIEALNDEQKLRASK